MCRCCRYRWRIFLISSRRIPMRMSMKTRRVFTVAAFFAGALAACNGGPGSSGGLPPERPAGVVSGYAIDGAIAGGAVRVFEFGNGVRGAPLGEALSDEHGFYSIDIRARDQPG